MDNLTLSSSPTSPNHSSDGSNNNKPIITLSQATVPLRVQNSQVLTEFVDVTVEDARELNKVYQILKHDTEGFIQLQAYEFEVQHLQDILRKLKKSFFSYHKVCRIVINKVLYTCRSYQFQLNAEKFHELARECHEIFPNYTVDTWYSNDSGPGGGLYSAYNTIREPAIGIGLIIIKKRKISATSASSEDFEWLKQVQPVLDEPYVTKWVETAREERKKFYNANSVLIIYQVLPNLASVNGHKLISADFKLQFGITEDNFNEVWSTLTGKIFSKAKTLSKTNEELQILLNDTKELTPDQKETLAFFILPHLFKKIIKTTAKKGSSGSTTNWAPENTEVLDNFLIRIKEPGDLRQNLELKLMRLKQFHLDHKLQWNTILVILHGPEDLSAEAYIQVGETIYSMKNLKTAVAVCVQIFKVLLKQPSRVTNHIWYFFESVVYGLVSQNNPCSKYAAVKSLIKDLSLLK